MQAKPRGKVETKWLIYSRNVQIKKSNNIALITYITK